MRNKSDFSNIFSLYYYYYFLFVCVDMLARSGKRLACGRQPPARFCCTAVIMAGVRIQCAGRRTIYIFRNQRVQLWLHENAKALDPRKRIWNFWCAESKVIRNNESLNLFHLHRMNRSSGDSERMLRSKRVLLIRIERISASPLLSLIENVILIWFRWHNGAHAAAMNSVLWVVRAARTSTSQRN